VKGVTLTGFEFALEDADISFGSSLGISNVIQAEPASVHLCSGIVALVEFSCVAP
jgi:thiamine pyrophosphokinase